jgi:hypothetical protein
MSFEVIVQTCSVCVRKRRRLEKTFVAPKSTKWVFKNYPTNKNTHTHTHQFLTYMPIYILLYILRVCIYVSMYVCMYVCVYNNAWKFEQVLSKETLVSVFFFFFFLKVPPMSFSLRERTTSEVYGLR